MDGSDSLHISAGSVGGGVVANDGTAESKRLTSDYKIETTWLEYLAPSLPLQVKPRLFQRR